MARAANQIDVYLEVGAKRTFASAVEWPGWCRSGRDETAALQALADYAPRYARVLSGARLGFQAPASVETLNVVERLKGNANTDFGAPGLAPSADARPVDEAELARLGKVLKACWRAFDQAVTFAEGKELRKGPRGGGRDQEKIIEHVAGGESSYVTALGGKIPRGQATDLEAERKAVLDALRAAAHGEFPAKGPRGGIRWTPRYFVRRAAWHVLDHAWEIEDRLE